MKEYKVAYNDSFGGFHLSEKAKNLLKERGYDTSFNAINNIKRHDKNLIEIIEQLGDKAGKSIKIYNLQHGSKYIIKEYDGLEKIIEPEDIEWIDAKEGA